MLIIYNRITSFLYTFFTLTLFHNIYSQSLGHVRLTSNTTISQKTNFSTPTKISSSTPSSTQTQMPFIYEPLPPSETIIVIVVISIITLIIGVVAIGITLSMFRQHKLKNSNVFDTTIDIEQQPQPREVNNFVESGFLEEP
ncbi:24944_t:CDS:1, partial [Gigaspora rosea]